MTRTRWSALGPGLILGVGLVGATAVAALNARSGWLVATAALLFVLSLFAADVLVRRRRGLLPRPSRRTLFLAGAFLVACGMLAAADPASVAMMIPVLGGGVAVPLLTSQAGACRRRALTAPSTGVHVC